MNNVEAARASGAVSGDEADRLISEAHFIRAYIYYGLVKRYGGVPIVDHAQDSEFVPGDASSVSVPRSTEKETWDFVLAECDKAAANLPESVSDYRASKWAALALKSRAALHAASVAKYWDKAAMTGEAVTAKLVGGMSSTDAQAYYQACLDASSAIITGSGKALYMPEPATVEDAVANYQNLFLNKTDEFIFGKAYLDGTINANQGHSYWQYNILPQVNTGGSIRYGRFNPTLDIVDAYESYSNDGVRDDAPIVTREDGVETPIANINGENMIDLDNPYMKYDDLSSPFEDKDARMHASIIVPGSNYGDVKIIMQGGIVKTDGTYAIYANESATGKDGKTYWGFGAEGSAAYSGFAELGGSENSNWSTTGFGIRKYMPEGKSFSGSWNASTVSFIDMRLAEIYLNYAEAQVESGKGDATLAKNYLNALRRRAAHMDEIELTLENVLKERRVELAFEGQRMWDLMRRREYHEVFNSTNRTILVPMIDLREDTPKYIFLRGNFHADERSGGRKFQVGSYYRSIPNATSDGLVQNPGY